MNPIEKGGCPEHFVTCWMHDAVEADTRLNYHRHLRIFPSFVFYFSSFPSSVPIGVTGARELLGRCHIQIN